MKKIFYLVLAFLIVNYSGYSQEQDTADEGSFSILVEGKAMHAPEVLSLYLQKKSISGEEILAADWLKGVCAENGLYITQFGDKNGNYNFSASLFPLSDSMPNIVFLNHMDVVPEGDPDLWDYSPWSGHITETEIWGRGAFDNKGAAIMQLFAVLQYKSESTGNEPYNVTFLAVSSEETQTGGGAEYVAKNHIGDLKPAIVVGEGATELGTLVGSDGSTKQFGISVTQKRPCWLKLSLTIPTSGHGSAPQDSYANKELAIALSKLLQKKQKPVFNQVNLSMLKSLGENERGITRFVLKHPVFFKPLIIPQLRAQEELFALYSNTIALTVLNSENTTINKIPGSAEAYLDCRIMPGYSTEEFIESVKKGLDNNEIEVELVLNMVKSDPSDQNGDFYGYMVDAVQQKYPGSSVYPIMLPNFNDVAWFRGAGVQGISIIPVEISDDHLSCIHKENERLPISALAQGIDTYEKFIRISMLK